MMTVDTIKEREKLAKEIARTSKSIRKKYWALKTGRMEKKIDLEKHFKPIVEPLKQIAENIGSDDDSVMTDATITPNIDIDVVDESSKNKRKRWSTEKKSSKRSSIPLTSPIQTSTPLQPRTLTFRPLKNLMEESVFETTNPSLVTSVRQRMQTIDGQETLYS
jgi:hypothetical protein